MIDKGINVKKIDLSGVSFPTSDASTCALIYTAVRNTYGFPLYLTNFKINDEKRDSILVNPIISENQTIINLNDCHLIVTPTDVSVGKGVYGASLESIVDKDGNLRFIEGDITIRALEGVTQTYGKWSLSGTHLMIVVCGKVEKDATITAGWQMTNIYLPSFILDKITPEIDESYVDTKIIEVRNNVFTSQNFRCSLAKLQDGTALRLLASTTMTATADLSFRIQFDLLIDSDYDE